MTDMYRIEIRDLALRQRFGLETHTNNRDWFAAPDKSVRIEITYGDDGDTGWGPVVSAVVIPAEGSPYTLTPTEVPIELTRLGAQMK